MNLRKGAFRMWVVISVFFASGVGIVSYSAILEDFKVPHVDLPVSCTDVADVIGNIGQPNAIMDDGICWYSPKDFRRLFPQYKEISDHDLAKKLYSKTKQPFPEYHPWCKVGETVSVAVGFPLVVLGLGEAFLWVVAGFKQTPEDR